MAADTRTDGYAKGSPAYRRLLIALGAVGITTFAQLYYPQAVIPAISRGYDVGPAAAALAVSGATAGLALSVLAWAHLADRIGRTPAIKIAVVATAVVGLTAPLMPTFPSFVIARALEGVALGGTPALALTYLHEEVRREHAPAAAGTYVSGTAIGGLVGRLVAAPVAELADWRAGALAVGALSAVSAAVVVLTVPDARTFQPLARTGGRTLWQGVTVPFRHPLLLMLYAQALLLMGAYVAVYNYLGYRLEKAPFDLSPSLAALLFLTSLSGTASARYAARFAARHGRRAVLVASAGLMAAGAALTVPEQLLLTLLGLTLFTAAFFAAHAIASGWVAPAAGSNPAQATSLYTLSYYLGSSVFGWLGGIAFAAGWTAIVVMVLTLVTVALSLAVSARIPRDLRR
ncbi:MFS transporter [Promicromonospora sukumoe]|uniref:MFS transporter n=1 Tax=Promicromonospora sukumoe TaxID=88382 RepID=UPI000363DA1B|nr:MFS transporter [Promicromonospora sukumoe]